MDPGSLRISRRGLRLTLFISLTVLAVFLALASYRERQRVQEVEFQRLANSARVIHENVTRQLEGVNNALITVVRDLDRFDRLDGGADLLHLRLKALSDSLPGVRTLNVLDAQGRVLASNRPQLLGRDFSQREYFTTPQRQPDPAALYLSQPFETVLGVYSLNLVRVTTTQDGRLDRLVAATLDPDFFKVVLSSVRFSDDVWVSLAHVDGTLVIRFPERPELLGRDLRQPESFFSRHAASGQTATVLSGESRVTGDPAWMAQHTIRAPALQMRGGLVVAVARDPRDALVSWRLLSLAAAATWVAVSLAALWLLWYLQRRQQEVDRRLAAEEELRRQAEEEVRHLAFYDALTDLPNRRLLYDRAQQLLATSLRQQRLSALLFLDLDGFKQLNDQHGHERGDQLLRQVAARIQAEIRQEDTAARFAGDEFVVMLAGLGSDAPDAARRAEVVAQKILSALLRPFDLDGVQFACSASLGVALFGHQEESIDAIIRRADEAMYQAKAAGRNTHRVAEG